MANGSKTLEDLFLATLRDIYDAEKQILKALPKMADAAASEELREAFEQHASETTGQVARLEQVFALIGQAARAKRCTAIRAIIGEGNEAIREFAGSEDGDLALAASAQAIEHYEIARYGTLKSWADQLGHDEAVQLLDATLQEETSTDRTLDALRQRLVGEMTGQSPEAETPQNRQASRSLRAGGADKKDREMPRDSNNRERDDQGRFVSDDDNRNARGRSGGDYRSSSRGRSDDDYRSRSRDDDDRGSSRASRDDDDRRGGQSGGRSQGGWFGDSQGHSEAARRGWETRDDDNRTSSRGRDDDDGRSRSSRDDDYYRSRSRDDDDRSGNRSRDDDGRFTSNRSRNEDDRSGNRSRDDDGRFTSRGSRDDDGRSGSNRSRDDDGRFTSRSARDEEYRGSGRGRSRDEDQDRGQQGWFGDSEGHSEAARRGWQNSDHRESGWFGDSEGHSDAARRGWEHRDDGRRSSRDDDDRSRGGNFGRSSRDDDDNRSSRSRSR